MNNLLFTLIPLVFFTSTLSGVIGMAGGMVLMGGLLVFYGPTEAIFLHGIIQFCANFQRYYQLRKHVQLRVFLFYTLGALLSYFLLKGTNFRPSKQGIYIFMALSAFLGSLQLKLPFTIKNVWVSIFGGFIVNAVQVFGGVAGPVLDAFFQDKRLNRFEIIGTKSITASVTHVLKVFFMAGLLETVQIHELLSPLHLIALLVASYAGTFYSKSILNKLSDKNFFILCSRFLMLLSVFYIWKAFV
jgi:uncharacterized membrane protein YfcA